MSFFPNAEILGGLKEKESKLAADSRLVESYLLPWQRVII